MNLKALVLATSAGLVLAGCNDDAVKQDVSLESNTQKVSYVLGTNVGSQFRSENIEVDAVAFLAGLEDVLADKAPRLSEEETVAALEAFQEQQVAKQQQAAMAASEKNQQEGQAYRDANAGKEGVVTLESGLQYLEVTGGEGEMPGADDVVEVHYKGTLTDGTVFDSSYERGVPAQFGVTQVIPGWTEALQLMQVGDKWDLVLPSDLAYGPAGTGGTIGPNQTLVFEVELLAINPGSEAEAE